MNYGAKLLGATISILYFLRLCGVLGEETDLRAPEIYADYFASHDVDDVVKGWLLHDNFLATRNALASIWNLENYIWSGDNSTGEDHNDNHCSMKTFFHSSLPAENIPERFFEESFSSATIRVKRNHPACYVLQESRNYSETYSSFPTVTVINNTRNDSEIDSSGCWLTDKNQTLVCDSFNMRSIPSFSHQLSLFVLNGTNLTYLAENSFGPSDITTIKIVGNQIKCIHPSAFEGVNVRILYIESNLIEYIRPDDFLSLVNTTTILLEHNNISLEDSPWGVSSYPGNCSSVLPNLNFFSLLGNPLTKIPSDYFCALRNSPVTQLDLTDCNLSLVEAGAFQYLQKLETLKLGENPLLMETLNGVLAQVKDSPLRHLNLESNSLSRIPKGALQYIWSNLTSLDLSGNLFDMLSSSSFPPDVTTLKELNLENCRIRILNNNTFQYMTSLTTLILSNNRLSSIPWTINNLPYLQILSMKSQVPAKSSMISIGDTIHTFKIHPEVFVNSQALKVLDLQHLSAYRVPILNDTFKYLGNLEHLFLSHSNIANIPPYSFRKLRKLKNLDLSKNKLTNILDVTFYGLENLMGLYLDSNNLEIPCPSSIPAEDKINLTHVQSFLESEHFRKVPWNDIDEIPLSTVSSGVEVFRYMPKLDNLSITNNRIRFVTSLMFQWQPKLMSLDLGGNLFKSWNERLFINGSVVKQLSLARNNIAYLSPAMLEDMLDIVSRPDFSLDLSENPLVCFESTCILMDMANNGTISLQHWDSENKYMCWDMWKNDYYSLRSPFECKSLNDKETTSGPTAIPLTTSGPEGVPLTTPHSSKPTTKIPITRTSSTTEREGMDRGESPPPKESLPVMKEHSPMTTIAIFIVSLVVVSCLIILGYKKRFHLKYFWFVVKFNVVNSPDLNIIDTKRKDSEEAPNYDFDIFVSYNHSDKEFIENYLVPHVEGECHDEECGDSKPLKICIHERDFKAGVPITDNIVDCVDRSRKVVVIVSKNYLESQWCLYEMNLAYHRLIESRRKAFVVVLLEGIPANLRTKSLNYLLLSRTYLEWPGLNATVSEQCTFWKRLRNSLADSG